MEVLGLVDIPWWLVCLLTTAFLLYLYTSYKQSYFRRLGIPTKSPVFLLGDIPDISKKGFSYIDADLLRKHGKCFGLYLGNYPEVIISDPEMIKQITVKEFSKFTNRAELYPLGERWESNVSIAKGVHWKFLRSTLSPSFSSGKLRHMTSMINRCIDTLKRNLGERTEGDCDMIPQFKGFTLDVICSVGFGLDVDSQKEQDDSEFVKYSKEFFNFNPAKDPVVFLTLLFPDLTPLLVKMGFRMRVMSQQGEDFFNSATRAAFIERKQADSRFNDILQLLLNAQKGRETADVLSDEGTEEERLLNAYKKRGITDEEILINSLIFMVAGFDTTANTLMWTSYCLATNPGVQDKLIQEIDSVIGQDRPSYENVFNLKYLDMVLNETLRMYPVAARINRQPSEDITICGKLLPKGLDCTIPISAIHHLPQYWPNPEKFDPERFSIENESKIVPYTFLPFGAGPRICLGMRLAQLKMKMAIVGLLQTYRLSPSPNLKIPPEVSPEGLLKPRDPLLLKLARRDTATQAAM